MAKLTSPIDGPAHRPTLQRTTSLPDLTSCDASCIAPPKCARADPSRHVGSAGTLMAARRTARADAPVLRLPALRVPKPACLTRLWRACVGTPRAQRADTLAQVLRSRVIDADTTVIFDLDSTLIRPRSGRYPADRSLWPALTTAVEPDTARVVRGLQDCGVPVFGLTARGLGTTLGVSQVTDAQLETIGVDLRLTAPVADVYDHHLPFRATTRHGVTYCGDNEKGDLFACLSRALPRTKRFVVIDDGLHNFPSLLEAAAALDVDLRCVYYRHDLSLAQRRDEAFDWIYVKLLSVR